ncbi:hypothetical protein GGR52DRAFT_439529 [Hypoxylon sp. FL1284]|nr:hypothetical protein GGR52DRAFT_439529 [Hypoxylon sp. FL1284]
MYEPCLLALPGNPNRHGMQTHGLHLAYIHVHRSSRPATQYICAALNLSAVVLGSQMPCTSGARDPRIHRTSPYITSFPSSSSPLPSPVFSRDSKKELRPIPAAGVFSSSAHDCIVGPESGGLRYGNVSGGCDSSVPLVHGYIYGARMDTLQWMVVLSGRGSLVRWTLACLYLAGHPSSCKTWRRIGQLSFMSACWAPTIGTWEAGTSPHV